MKTRHILRRISCILVLVCLVCTLPLQAAADGNVVIVLDPGHGGGDPGSVATYGGVEYLEADLVWKITGYCKDYLETHYTNVTVYLTHTQEENPSLEERVNIAVNKGADFLLSIHLNVYAEGTARGATALVPAGTYHPEQAQISQDVGSRILARLEGLGLKNRGLYTHTLKITKYPNGGGADSYYLLRHGVEANLPTIIMEECFIDDAQDFQNVLSTEEKLQALGEANAVALAEYFELNPDPNAPVVNPVENTEPEETTADTEETTANTEETTEATEATEPATAPTGSGLGSVLKVMCIVLLIWFLVKCWQFHQFRKREAERRRRAKARAEARRKAQRARQVNPDGTYPRPSRQIPGGGYSQRTDPTAPGTANRSRPRSDHRNNYMQ